MRVKRIKTVKNLHYYRDLVEVLVSKELKIRYKNTILGYVWSLANPIAFALTFFIAFKNALRLDIPNYILFLLIGLFPWQFFANAIGQAPSMFIANANIIKKVIFPRFLLIFGLVGNHAFHFGLTLPVLLLFMLGYGVIPNIVFFLGLPILFFNQLILIIGLSLFISSLNLFFRDMENLTQVLTNLLFYLTPVLYKRDMIPAEYQLVLSLNPMTNVIELWRDLMLSNTINIDLLLKSSIVNLLWFLLGVLVYKKLEKRFAEVV